MTKKKSKIIKRIYEEGREKTVFYAKRKSPVKKQTKDLALSEDTTALPSRLPESIRQPVRKAKRAGYVPKPAPPLQEPRPVVDHYELPSSYGKTYLVLMAKDPFRIYAYWEIAPHSVESLRNILPKEDTDNSKIVLRMYDVTLKDFDGTNANHYFDIEVGHINNWYVNLWFDNVAYVGDIGLRLPDGRFFTLARSNVVETPRMNYSPRSEQIWMEVTDEKYTRPYALDGKLQQVPAARALARPSAPSIKVTEISSTKRRTRVLYLRESEIRQYYGKLSPLLKEVIGDRVARQHGRDDAHWFSLEGDTEEERRGLLSLLPKEYFTRRLFLGSSQELAITQGASEQLVSRGGASDFVQKKMEQQKFFFELNTELIVYGRTEPDAEVKLGDKKVHLRSDGTFSLRFALPDGKIPLEFKAASKDRKEERRINTYVERNTVRKD